MNRIESIFSFIDTNDKVVDVGCDQAKIGLMLAKRKQYSIATDISENVINKAKNDIGNNKYIDLRVSNGLEKVYENEADTLVLAGMGTHNILEIMSKTSLRFKKIITVSNNYHNVLRKGMNNLNYVVDSELIIKENNKYYNLIVFKEGKKDYTQEEIYLGINHINKDLYNEYLLFLLNKYEQIKLKSLDKNDKVDLMILMIKNKLNN